MILVKLASEMAMSHSGNHPQPTPATGFDFQPRTRLVLGVHSVERVGELAKELGARKVLLVTDHGLVAVGHAGHVRTLLEAAGLFVTVFDKALENPTTRCVDHCAAAAKHAGVDTIIGLGGGSSMDTAKGANFILTNGGRMRDYKGHDKATKPMLPSVGVPTTSGTGSEAQSYALITDESSHMKMACGDKKAAFRVSILDPELTLSQPKGLTAVTGIDAVAHAVESLVCTKANPLSRMCSRAAFEHLEPHFETVLKAPADLAARSHMQLGAHLAGMAIEASMLGVCHSCANPLTAHYGITHGVAIGIMLPHVVRFNAAVAGELYASLYGSADRLAHRVAQLVRAAGLPTSLKECGVAESILPVLADEANQQWTARFNPRPVTDKEILSLYHAAW